MCRTRGEGVLDAGGSTELCSKRKRAMETMTTAQNRISRVVFWQPVISNLYQGVPKARLASVDSHYIISDNSHQPRMAEDMEEGFTPCELQSACVSRTSGPDVTRDRRNTGGPGYKSRHSARWFHLSRRPPAQPSTCRPARQHDLGIAAPLSSAAASCQSNHLVV